MRCAATRSPRRGSDVPLTSETPTSATTGLPVAVIAKRYGITAHQVQYRVGGVPRPKPKARRPSRWPELDDAAWLRVELAIGQTRHTIAAQLG
jgi:hypothetical protein